MTFTGLELATANVPEHARRDIQHNGTVVAAITLACVAVGLVLLLTVGSLADFELHEGYSLSVASLAVVAVLRRARSFQLGREAGRRGMARRLRRRSAGAPARGDRALAKATDV